MTTYRDQSWNDRYKTMGDPAEDAYRQAFPRHYRNGLDRPDIAVSKLPLLVRSSPDFGDYEGLCECIGFGADQIVKLRIEKIIGLLQWSATHNVSVFLWNGKKKQWARGPIDEFVDALFQHGEYGTFNDGNKMIGLRARFVPWSWVVVNPRLDSVHVEGA